MFLSIWIKAVEEEVCEAIRQVRATEGDGLVPRIIPAVGKHLQVPVVPFKEWSFTSLADTTSSTLCLFFPPKNRKLANICFLEKPRI